MRLALLAEADVAGTLGEALGPETVAAGSQALGFTLRLDLRRELVPDSGVCQTSGLSIRLGQGSA